MRLQLRSLVGTLLLLAAFVAALIALPDPAGAAPCPCSVFGPLDTPTLPDAADGASVNVGMRFRADADGYVTAVRFFRAATADGTHVGALWTSTGTLLGTATFTGESASGWQTAQLATPIAVTANTTYVASYLAPVGHYAASTGYFSSSHDSAPLHGLADGADGANGVYGYGSSLAFPTSTYNSANYWVDVVFDTTNVDTTPPTVSSTAPAAGATAATRRTDLRISFSEPVDPASISSATIALHAGTAGGTVVPTTVSYDAAQRAAVLRPTASLARSATYVLTATGGASGARVLDVAGNALAATASASFTTDASEPEDGPGGPILVVTDPAVPYSYYVAEILRAEGLDEFETVDASQLTAAVLSAHTTTIVGGNLPLTSAQASLLTTWVTLGGDLALLRPDKQLASLAGLTDANATLANGYLKVDTTTTAGAGIVGATTQFHGTADRYVAASGTSTIATLFSDATTATTAPAVTLRTVGTAGGQVATFTYDLARSVVLTHQGNPAWAGTERDGAAPAAIRASDMFFGAKAGDVQPDWNDLSKASIPQADEQQRLLANLVTTMNLHAAPLPRFWYLPDSRPAVVVYALDDHATAGGTRAELDALTAASPAGCVVAKWQCYRQTAWDFLGSSITDAQAAAYASAGFDLGSHIDTGCADYSSVAELRTKMAAQLKTFRTAFPSLPPQRGNRTHCIIWSDWDSIPKASLANGIRFDMGYYYWAGDDWAKTHPGFMGGAGFPMRYAQVDGRMIDVFQQVNDLVNQTDSSAASVNALLDKATGPEGYYGAFGVHDDYSDGTGAYQRGILASAQAHGVGIVSADQMLTWTDARNASSYTNVAYANGRLTFGITAATGSTGLTGMVPTESADGTLASLAKDGTTVTTTTKVVKGISYAMFPASAGSWVATYGSATVLGNRTPASPADSDTAAVELGMRFSSDVAGTVTGVRFYKGAGNTGTHTGTLWTTSGTKLAQVTFTGETATGWQRASFASPVSITAGTQYVVSYHAPSGHYAGDSNGFATAIDATPLHAPADTASAHNGLYRYGTAVALPNASYQAANYYVDVLFKAAATTTTPPPTNPPTGPTCPCTLFPATATPASTATNDSAAVELGMRFSPDTSGFITGVRFFKAATNTGTHTGSLWSATGTLLGSVTFSGETASGWQQATLATPVAVTAGTTYVVSYQAPNGNYSYTGNGFASAVDNAPLHAPADSASAHNGLFAYGATSFPTGSYGASNYFVDVVFSTTAGGGGGADTTPPTITSTTPASGATGVGVGANVSAVASEALAAASVTASSVELRDAAGTLVPATVTYDAATRTATLDPTPLLATGATYTARIHGGAATPHVTDVAGNALAADLTWSFTTSTGTATTTTVFAATSTPTTASANDTSAVEVGMKFRSDVAGSVTGIRFYKASDNTGTHVGHLWSASGTLLATVTFSGESASGWQQADLSTPVALVANTTYVVSYHAPAGHYAGDNNGFTAAVDHAPLHGLASGTDGGNGVYAYGGAGTFPTNTWMSSNYWVDVAFSAS